MAGLWRRSARPMAAIAACMMLAPVSQARAPGVLSMLEPGQWELIERGDPASRRLVCLGDRSQLVQVRHPGLVCRQQLMMDNASETTVHYVCPGAGEGHTTIRPVTPRAAIIETQGLVDGVPFHLDVDARRVGACPAAMPRR